MDNEHNGRTGAFLNGSASVNPTSTIRTIQSGAGREGFRPNSLLMKNHIISGANGMSEQDRARNPIGGPHITPNGQSADTFSDSMLIGNKPRQYGAV